MCDSSSSITAYDFNTTVVKEIYDVRKILVRSNGNTHCSR